MWDSHWDFNLDAAHSQFTCKQFQFYTISSLFFFFNFLRLVFSLFSTTKDLNKKIERKQTTMWPQYQSSNSWIFFNRFNIAIWCCRILGKSKRNEEMKNARCIMNDFFFIFVARSLLNINQRKCYRYLFVAYSSIQSYIDSIKHLKILKWQSSFFYFVSK